MKQRGTTEDGRRMIHVCAATGLTQNAIADVLGLTHRQVSRIVNGRSAASGPVRALLALLEGQELDSRIDGARAAHPDRRRRQP